MREWERERKKDGKKLPFINFIQMNNGYLKDWEKKNQYCNFVPHQNAV